MMLMTTQITLLTSDECSDDSDDDSNSDTDRGTRDFDILTIFIFSHLGLVHRIVRLIVRYGSSPAFVVLTSIILRFVRAMVLSSMSVSSWSASGEPWSCSLANALRPTT